MKILPFKYKFTDNSKLEANKQIIFRCLQPPTTPPTFSERFHYIFLLMATNEVLSFFFLMP